MRVADKMAYDQVNRAIGKNRTEMATLQNQAATQKRVNKPSDDPVAASRVLFSRVEQRGSEQFVKNLNYAKGFLDFTEQSLSELTEVLVRAKELAISQSNDASASSQTRRIVAEEIKQLHNQIVQIANRKLGERFIFGGFKTNDAPFDENGNYAGDKGEMKIHVDKESFLAMNMPGSIVFQGDGLSTEGFTYKSLQQPRSTKELAKQKLEHPDSYALKGGAEAMRDSMANEQRVNEALGDVDAGRGPASENGKTESDRSPASLRVTSNVSRPISESAGDEAEESNSDIQGVNLFHALRKLEIALQTDDKTGVQESLDRLDAAMQQVVVARTSLGSRVMTIDNTLGSMHTNIVDSKSTISSLEDADAFEVISDINKTESALQATLQTSGKLMQKSLMDFIS